MEHNWITNYKYAHRGLHNEEFPENSLGAFKNTINYGFAIELDIRMLNDGTLVVFHDENLERMCGKDIELNILNKKDLKKYPLLNSRYLIPTLQEVLELVDGQVPIIVELKPLRRKDKLSEHTYDIIKDYKGKIAIKSFNHLELLWFKHNAPNIPRGMLGCSADDLPMNRIYKSAIKKLFLAKFVKPHFISYDINDLPSKYVSKQKIPTMAWTIKSKEEERTASNLVDTIIFEKYIPDHSKNEPTK